MATEDEMVKCHHQLIGHEFEQTPGHSEGQGGLACCCPCGLRVRHDLVTEQQVCGVVIGGEWTEVMEVPGCLLVEP